MADSPLTIEEQKLQFEREKLRQERHFRQLELDLRETELKLKEQELNKSKWQLTPVNVGVLVAILGIIGSVATLFIQSKFNRDLEKLKFQSDLLMKVSTDEAVQNRHNLNFLLNSGILHDDSGKIRMVMNLDTIKFKVPGIQSLEIEEIDQQNKLVVENILFSSTLSLENAVRGRTEFFAVDALYQMSGKDAFEFYDSSSLPYKRALDKLFNDSALTVKKIGIYWKSPALMNSYAALLQMARKKLVPLTDQVLTNPFKPYINIPGGQLKDQIKLEAKNRIRATIEKLQDTLEELRFLIGEVNKNLLRD